MLAPWNLVILADQGVSCGFWSVPGLLGSIRAAGSQKPPDEAAMGSPIIPTTLRNSADAPIRDLSPLQPLLSPWRHRDLVLRLGRRDIESRYRGSALGLIWAILQPLVLLAVYTFVFGVVFKMRATKIGYGGDAAAQVE